MFSRKFCVETFVAGFLILLYSALHLEHLPLLPWWDELDYVAPEIQGLRILDFFPWKFPYYHFNMGHPPLHTFAVWILSFILDDFFVAGRALAILSTAFCLLALLKIGQRIENTRTAVMAGLILVSIPSFYIQSFTILADIFAMALGFWGIYYFSLKSYKSSALLFFLCTFTRESGVAFPIAALASEFFLSSSREQKLIAVKWISPSILYIPLHFFFMYIRTGKWSIHPYFNYVPHSEAHISNFLTISEPKALWFLMVLRSQMPTWLLGFGIICFVPFLAKRGGKSLRVSISLVAFFFFSFFFFYEDNLPRNFLPFYLAFSLAMASLVNQLFEFVENRFPIHRSIFYFLTLLAFFVM